MHHAPGLSTTGQVVSTKANAPAARIGTGLRALDYQVAR